MVIYEITATVRGDLCGSYERFLTERHIPDLLETGAFTSASFETSGGGRYRIRYFSASEEDLATYLSEHAPRLRQDFADHFTDGVELTREEWRVLKHFA